MDKTQKALKERYSHIHPLIFQRSLDKSKTNGELFDILDTFPQEYPVLWNEKTRRWEHTKDLLLSNSLNHSFLEK